MGAGMKGACTCLHLGRQAPKKKTKKEQEGFVGEGEGTRRQCRAQSKREKKKEGGR